MRLLVCLGLLLTSCFEPVDVGQNDGGRGAGGTGTGGGLATGGGVAFAGGSPSGGGPSGGGLTSNVGGGTGRSGFMAGGTGAFGGLDNTSFQKNDRFWLVGRFQTVEGRIVSDGGLDGWDNYSSAIPSFVSKMSGAVSGDVAYLVGGASGTGPSDAVFTASLRDGVLGPYTPARALPLPLQSHATIVAGGDLIVVGGFGQSPFTFEHVATVLAARIQPDGSLEPWRTLTPLPSPRAGHAVGVLRDQLYCLGGENGLDASIPDVVVATLVDGGLGQWRSLPPITRGRTGHAVFARDENLIVFGGNAGGVDFFDVQIAEFDGGVLSGWHFGPPMRVTRATPTLVTSGNDLHLLGGRRDSFLAPERYLLLPSGELQRQ